ncbi:MAG: VWA domain-containing protein, partial [Candidatus Firestonebacteria bacterium]|nr:VWA domain-containing protein [Candidatus Firestonebacteria bacterium]
MNFSELTFIEPKLLWLLAVVPLLVFFKALEFSRRRKALAKFSELSLFLEQNAGQLGPKQAVFPRLLLYSLGLILLVLALARPGGYPKAEEEQVTEKGLDIMLVVDLSASMKATDLQPSRMQATKAALKDFVEGLSTDRVGLVVFAGSVSLQSPLTLDYRTAKMMMDIINTDFLPVDGTAIGDAINFSLDKIGKENQKNAVLVLVTDGENTRGSDPEQALKKAKEAGTKIYTIGIGTPGGAQIPDGTDEKGQPRVKLYNGAPVVTKLDEVFLKKAAEETGGVYYSTASSQALLQAYADISRLTKTTHTEKKKKMKYQEFYLWAALPALVLLILEFF